MVIDRLTQKDCREEYHLNQFDSSVLFVAPHGGGIEPGTDILCREISNGGFSYYSYICPEYNGDYGINHPFHIPSHRFNTPRSDYLVSMHERVCSLHLFNEQAEVVHVGGIDTKYCSAISDSLNHHGFSAILDLDNNCGLHRNNICNRGRFGMGVQLEISTGLAKCLIVDSKLTVHGKSFTDIVRLFWRERGYLQPLDV